MFRAACFLCRSFFAVLSFVIARCFALLIDAMNVYRGDVLNTSTLFLLNPGETGKSFRASAIP
ncbi:hypothetical protein P3T16_006088 [Paraburkholderia sp. GAS42]|jgi:hypothetical protein